MPCKIHFATPVLFIRWVESCQVSDMATIEAAIEDARAQCPDDLVYLAIIPVNSIPPDGDARAAMRTGIGHASEFCKSIHIVIEGQGLRRALIRSISAGLLLATRKTSNGFHIHETVDQAVDKADLGAVRRTAVLKSADDAGILTED